MQHDIIKEDGTVYDRYLFLETDPSAPLDGAVLVAWLLGAFAGFFYGFFDPGIGPWIGALTGGALVIMFREYRAIRTFRKGLTPQA